jgi:hypothetical protein
VKLVSVQQGADGGLLASAVQAAVDEDAVRQLAKRVKPAREKAARGGTHCGPTPYGYLRLYPQQAAAHGRLPVAELVADPDTAPTVKRIFERYAYGPPMTLRQLALWANEQPDLARPPRAAAWAAESLHYLLRNPVYKGDIAYNRYPSGAFESAKPGEAFVTRGRHGPLVTAELWAAVEARLGGAPGPRARRGHDGVIPLAAGLLMCGRCGGRMARYHGKAAQRQQPGYNCQNRRRGTTTCAGEYILMDVAHAALLAQLRRLRWQRWDRAAAGRVVSEGEQDASTAVLLDRLQRVRLLYHDHVEQGKQLEDFDQELIEAHRAMGWRLYAQLQALEEQVAAAGGEAGANLATLEKLHNRLRTLAADVDCAVSAGDLAALRALVAPLVRSARIVQRVPETRTTWARAAVEWTNEVALLLKAGVLALADDVTAPEYDPERAARRRELQRAYIARKRLQLAVASA